MRHSVLAAAGVSSLLPLVSLAACPSLGDIGVGTGLDATVDRPGSPPPEDGPVEARADARSKDAGRDASCTADVASDPHNCGRCGHDCLGGACASGACEAVVLYAGGDTPTSIVVDGPDLFVTVDSPNPSDGYVFRCAAANCMATKTVLATGLLNPWFAVGHGGRVFWDNSGGADGGAITTSGSVVSCAETGCPDAGPLVYTPPGVGVDGGANITGLALDSTYLYWADLFSYGGTTGAIYQCAMSDCPGTLVELVGGTGFIPITVAVDPMFAYWTDIGTNQVLRCKLPTCGGNPQIFANDQTSASGLALFGGDVYWTQGVTDGGVLHCPSTGCGAAPAILAAGQANPFGLAVDGSGAYWANIDDGTVMRCALAGCVTPTQIARTLAPFAIALDPVSVYFTNSTALGQVLRVAK